MPNDPPHQLQYAKTPSLRHRKSFRRFTFGIFVIGVGTFLSLWAPRTYRKYRLLSLQRRCLDYTAPPDLIVFDARTESLPLLHRSDPEYLNFSLGILPGVTPLGGGIPGVGRIPVAWRDYSSAIYPPGFVLVGTAFVHRLVSPSGNVRLVAADLIYFGISSDPMSVFPYVICPATLTQPAQYHPSSEINLHNSIAWYDVEWFVAFAGQVDSAHPDHFTFTFMIGPEIHIVDGWLRDDDTLQMKDRYRVLSTPLTPSSP